MQLPLFLFTLFSLLFSLANAQYKVTNPTSNDTWKPATPYTVKWRATGHKKLADYGTMTVSLYGGAKSNRTLLTTFGTAPATAQQMAVNIPANLGPAGEFYFFHLRSSVTGKALLSNKFQLSGMTGSFNATLLAAIHGGSSNSSRSSNATATRAPLATTGTALRTTGTSTAKAIVSSTSGSMRSMGVGAALLTLVAGAMAVLA